MNNTKRNVFAAILIIYVGIVWFLRNIGMISPEWFRILFSWQLLVIFIGIRFLCSKRIWGSLVLIAIGTLFLLPKFGILAAEWLHLYWPLALVFIGMILLFRPPRKHHPMAHHRAFHRQFRHGNPQASYGNSDYESKDGYVTSNNTFGGDRQIVLDPVFRGANIRNMFGGTVLDLRRTRLEAEQTYIDVECMFGGIEIYLPAEWKLQLEVDTVAGECEDKRYPSILEIDTKHVLIVRGKITFGGIDFKN